jgi:hypothetical protein
MKLESAGVDTLVQDYRQAAREFAAAIAEGDHRKANARHSRATKIYTELRNRGAEAQRALLPLLGEDSPVRLWAATHALDFAPELGEAELEHIANSDPTPLGALAKTLLRSWKEGTLQRP